MTLKNNRTAKAKINGDNNLTIQNSVFYNNTTIDEVTTFIKDRQIDDAINTIDTLNRAVAGQHPLFPYYKTAIISNESGKIRLKSVPITQEALIKYPPKIHAKITLPNKYRNFKSFDSLLEYSYREQKDIEFSILELKKMLGDIVDPYFSFNDKGLTKMSGIIKHKDFPPPQPMKLYFKDNSFSIDYLEIGLDKIEGNTLYFNNKRQNNSIFFEFTFNVDNTNESSFRYNLNEAYKYKVNHKIQYMEFIKNFQMKKGFALKLLKEEKNIFEAKEYEINSTSNLFDNDEYLFLKDLELIEKTLEIEFKLGRKIQEEDINNTYIVIQSIRGKEIEGTYSELKAKLTVDDNLRLNLKEYRTSSKNLVYKLDNMSLKIFNITVPVKVTYDFYKPEISEYDNIIKKIDVLDNGDDISIKFIPSETPGKVLIKYKI